MSAATEAARLLRAYADATERHRHAVDSDHVAVMYRGATHIEDLAARLTALERERDELRAENAAFRDHIMGWADRFDRLRSALSSGGIK